MTSPDWIERTMNRDLPVVLVACSGQKLGHAAEAQDLYTSALFKKARAWAERYGAYWFILSAKHGVVPPGKVIKPYDERLSMASTHERAMWDHMVKRQYAGSSIHPTVILAGKNYRGWAEGRGYSVPMAGMGIGRQLAWLTAELARPITTEAAACT